MSIRAALRRRISRNGRSRSARYAFAATVAAGSIVLGGCQWQGMNSLPLPGAAGRGSDGYTITIEMPNVSTITPNSPVMLNDVTVGSVSKIQTDGWHAKVTVALKKDVVLPWNTTAKVGQTSLLGSQHIELAPPVGQPARGRLRPGDVIPIQRSSGYPTTENTLMALATVLNGGGLAQVQTIVSELDKTFGGHDGQIRDLIGQLDTLVGTLDRQRDAITTSIDNLHTFSGQLASENTTLAQALDALPPAVQTLSDDRGDITDALRALTDFSNKGVQLVNDTGDDLKKNLSSLNTTLAQVASAGDSVINNLGTITTFPFPQVAIDNGMRGDYTNLWAVLDLTIPRLRQGVAFGSPIGPPDGLQPVTPTPAAGNAAPAPASPIDPLLAPLHLPIGGHR